MEINLPHLSIRKVILEDAYFINQYWADATDQDFIRLGELGWPDPQGNIVFIKEFCSMPLDPKTADEDIRMWCVDGNTVGYSSLKSIRFQVEGQIHLHMARPYWGKGLGAVLFCLSALEFISTFELNDLYCQPKADNPMPNGMLKKVGFPILGQIKYERQDGSVILQNRYHILPSVIKRYFEQASAKFVF